MTEQRKIRVLEGIRQGKVGGGESYLLSLVENLDRNHFEPIVLSFTDGPMVDRLRNNGIKVHVIYTEKPFDIRIWGKVKSLIKSEEIDIVHAHGTRANSNLFWAARKLKLPIVYTCHAWSFHPDQNPIMKKLRILSEDFLTSKMNVNICGSLANRNEGRRLFKDFDATVIYNSIDPDKFNPYGKYKDIRSELGISNKEIIVTSIARFTIQKQPLKLIKAFHQVVKVVNNVRLLMVGDGELKQQSLDLAYKLGIQEKITFQPFRHDVPDVLASSDIFVLPSLWEAFPIALLEAMSMGKAIIATDVDGTPEMVEDGENGILISVNKLIENLSESIIRLCSDEKLRNKLQSNAIQSIYNKYNVKTLAKSNEEIYYNLFLN